MAGVLGRLFIVGIGVIVQVLINLLIYLFLIDKIWIVSIFYGFLSVLLILGLIRNSKNYSNTLPWIIILILFPLAGTLLYVILGKNKHNSKVLKSIVKSEKDSKKYLIQDEKIRREYDNNSRLRYISDFAEFPVTKNNKISYYQIGEKAYEAMLEELEKAEKFIFFEYFIVDHGKMWNAILEILEEKVKNGVDVRVIYDDLGSLNTLKKNYSQVLEKKGIKCVVFNRLNPIAGVIMNNRDHRKILVIDGKVAFSGGINIADEYINEIERHGHWKDNGIKISGDGVWNYSVMFLTMWNSYRAEDEDFNKFKYDFKDKKEKDGYVVPYAETPLDEEATGEDVYLNIINLIDTYHALD